MAAHDLQNRTPLIAVVLLLVAGLAFATCGLCSAYAAETDSDQSLTTGSINAQSANSATYRILFKANGGKGTMKPQTVKRGKKTALRASTFTRSGYKFAGWNTKKNGKGKSCKNKAKVKNLAKAGKTVKLYAQWKKAGNKNAKAGIDLVQGWWQVMREGGVRVYHFTGDNLFYYHVEDSSRTGWNLDTVSVTLVSQHKVSATRKKNGHLQGKAILSKDGPCFYYSVSGFFVNSSHPFDSYYLFDDDRNQLYPNRGTSMVFRRITPSANLLEAAKQYET